VHRQAVDNTEKKITHRRILNEWAHKTTKKKFQRKKKSDHRSKTEKKGINIVRTTERCF